VIWRWCCKGRGRGEEGVRGWMGGEGGREGERERKGRREERGGRRDKEKEKEEENNHTFLKTIYLTNQSIDRATHNPPPSLQTTHSS